MKRELQRMKAAGILSIRDAIILDELANDQASINELVGKTGDGASTLDAALRRLDGLGLVAREYICPSYKYRITPTGRSIFTL